MSKFVKEKELQWKKVELDEIDHMNMDLDGFYMLEEIDGVDVVKLDQAGGLKTIGFEMKNIKAKKKKSKSAWSVTDTTEIEAPLHVESEDQEENEINKEKDAEELEENKIIESNDEIDITNSSWQGYDLNEKLTKQLIKGGYIEPTMIQQTVLSYLSNNPYANILVGSETGSGKTLAFVLPLINLLSTNQTGLIIAPTRELATQISQVVSIFTKATLLIGGISLEKQRRLLSHLDETKVVIATPGRFWDLLCESEELKEFLIKVQILVVDEADRLFYKTKKINEEFEKILKYLLEVVLNKNKKLRFWLFSATIQLADFDSDSCFGKFVQDGKLKFKQIGSKAATIKDRLSVFKVECLEERKGCFLYKYLHEKTGRIIVFFNSIKLIEKYILVLKKLFKSRKIYSLHAKQKQKDRLSALEKNRFEKNEDAILICSDVAARGLDIANVDVVVHFHVPRNIDVYLHRTGRTARLDKVGESIVFVSPKEHSAFDKLAKMFEIQVGLKVQKHSIEMNNIKKFQKEFNLAFDSVKETESKKYSKSSISEMELE
ncbi:P-loop containing nucleoside triphosphate hydrolase protein [Rozella allomycis CSF55]|uniref:ATP-dependent RNA helicase n=1 Tax=Rozella allomycis (strain CSF55) TaxID=988480 RepID=A0A4P9YP53_ROZAC|nr:P-loop containing nucleoside triphosphate hydrolase protein [Rozella allomycis CSF55]